ncbi:MAG: radical SAM protein [Paracoccaceae bacterium]
MNDAEIDAFRAPGRRYAGPDTAAGRRAPLATALARQGRMTPGQTAGRFYAVACVALEVTQRCNLDCTLCYLSPAAEAAHDVPMTVLFARLRSIRDHFGPGTAVQISGGDPTLRRVEDLEALCREIRRLGLWPCLMTNGIRATRPMLARLAGAGLVDVAFHVDTTQERQGGETEIALNGVRREYLARARGLGLRVFFNTTVHAGNMAELPALARFFRTHAHEITMTSFQLQADTGRGVMGARTGAVTQAGVEAALAEGFATALDFGVAGVGHEACNRYASVLVAGDRATAALGDRALFHRIVAAFEAAARGERATVAFAPLLRRAVLAAPLTALRAALHVAGRVLRLGPGLVASRGRVARLALFVHNFMDAEALERDRCEACVFRVATEDGPLSMCVHNARRDRHLFRPARVETADGQRWWSAATGRLTRHPETASPGVVPPKRRKGRDAIARRPQGSGWA